MRALTWSWDYLANQTEWTDDAARFYERSLGDIVNGDALGASSRPSALYAASNFTPSSGSGGSSSADSGSGWVEVTYGVGGNVTAMTVHGQCDASTCAPPPPRVPPVCAPDVLESCLETHRIAELLDQLDAMRSCECAVEQHYQYRWDELNRLAEARRFDHVAPTTTWTLAARQRYRYDASNQRTVKQTLDPEGCGPVGLPGIPSRERIALSVYPGDFERRGLRRDGGVYVADGLLGIETQYVVAGARWVNRAPASGDDFDREQRLTVGVADLIQTTAAVIDVRSGALLESSTYYPNGGRETFLRDADARAPPEPNGFTGKEAEEEVGVVYFGERWLVSRLGRWASPDPLHVHAVGGGEALNSYHYVAGSLLAARDPMGLDGAPPFTAPVFIVEASRRASNERTSGRLESGNLILVNSQVNLNVTNLVNPDISLSPQHATDDGRLSVVHIAAVGPNTEDISFRQWLRTSGSFTTTRAGRTMTHGFSGNVSTCDGHNSQFSASGPSPWHADAAAAEAGYPNYNGFYEQTMATTPDGPGERYAACDSPYVMSTLSRFFTENPAARIADSVSAMQDVRTEIVEGGNVTAVGRWHVISTPIRGRLEHGDLPSDAELMYCNEGLDLTYCRQVELDGIEARSPRPVDPPRGQE